MLLTLVLIILIIFLLSGKGVSWNRGEPIGFLLTILLVVILVILILSFLPLQYPYWR